MRPSMLALCAQVWTLGAQLGGPWARDVQRKLLHIFRKLKCYSTALGPSVWGYSGTFLCSCLLSCAVVSHFLSNVLHISYAGGQREADLG